MYLPPSLPHLQGRWQCRSYLLVLPGQMYSRQRSPEAMKEVERPTPDEPLTIARHETPCGRNWIGM